MLCPICIRRMPLQWAHGGYRWSQHHDVAWGKKRVETRWHVLYFALFGCVCTVSHHFTAPTTLITWPFLLPRSIRVFWPVIKSIFIVCSHHLPQKFHGSHHSKGLKIYRWHCLPQRWDRGAGSDCVQQFTSPSKPTTPGESSDVTWLVLRFYNPLFRNFAISVLTEGICGCVMDCYDTGKIYI